MHNNIGHRRDCPEKRGIDFAAAKMLRQLSLWMADDQPLTDHLNWMTQNGMSREDSRQIRYIVDVFANSEPTFTIIHALESHGSECRSAEEAGCGLLPDAVKKGYIKLAPTAASVTSPRGCKGHPFFRALAVWPDYARYSVGDLKNFANYNKIVSDVAQFADSIALQLCPEQDDIEPDSQCSELMLDASAEVVVASFAMHKMFVAAEASARCRSNP